MDSMVFNNDAFHRCSSSESDGSELSDGSEVSGKKSWGLTSIYVDVDIDWPWSESCWDSSISRV